MRQHTILFPTDFSESATAALEEAIELAKALRSQLHLFHAVVLETPFVIPADGAATIPGPQDLLDEMDRHAASELETAAAHVRESGIEVTTVARRGGDTVDSILQYAEELQVDLIVMSSHGRRGFRRLLVGSVTEELVRRADCPVLAIRRDPELEPPTAPSTIVAAVDLSDHSREVISAAKLLAASLGRELELVHVVHIPTGSTVAAAATPFGPATPAPPEGVSYEDRLDSSRELLEHLFNTAPGPEVEARALVRSGKPEDEIVESAEQSGASLIVVGTEGHSGVSRLLLGSVCERLLRRAPCAVYVVPKAAAS